MIEYDNWQQEDVSDILGMLATNDPARASLYTSDYFRWQFVDHPAGPPIAMVARSEGRAVGFLAWQFVDARIDSHREPICLVMAAIVRPEFRGKSIFTTLLQREIEAGIARHLNVVYAFPSPMSYRTFTRRFGFAHVRDIPYWVTITDPQVLRRRSRRGWVAPLWRLLTGGRHRARRWLSRGRDRGLSVQEEVFGEDFEGAYLCASKAYTLSIWRDLPYLRWRYEKHPAHRYRILTVRRGGELLGYAIRRGALLVDLVCCEDREAATCLLAATVEDAAREDEPVLNCYLAGDTAARRSMLLAGFRPWNYAARPFGLLPAQHLIVKGLSGSVSSEVLSARNWWFTAGDINPDL